LTRGRTRSGAFPTSTPVGARMVEPSATTPKRSGWPAGGGESHSRPPVASSTATMHSVLVAVSYSVPYAVPPTATERRPACADQTGAVASVASSPRPAGAPAWPGAFESEQAPTDGAEEPTWREDAWVPQPATPPLVRRATAATVRGAWILTAPNLRANWHQIPGFPGPVRIGARPLSSRRGREGVRSLGPDHGHRRRVAGPRRPRRCGSAASRPRAPSSGGPGRS
jgi:hypothetical protein